ncbi:MAG: RtcB family protein, partial [Clostridia bacterium]|nr:RtcB family protein [Clostridia bacterium]
VRKGAIPAHLGQKLIVPMNMRDGCLLVVGKGNPDWNYSAPHGAGRLVSRGEAKELFTVEEYKKEMAGIYTTCANLSTIDESPMAYKPTEEIMRLIQPTVEIVKVIKPIYNFKDGKKDETEE